MGEILFSVCDDYRASTIADLVHNFNNRWLGQYRHIEATVQTAIGVITLPLPEDVYSQLYAPTDPSASQSIRRFKPKEELKSAEAAWRKGLKEELKGLAERF